MAWVPVMFGSAATRLLHAEVPLAAYLDDPEGVWRRVARNGTWGWLAFPYLGAFCRVVGMGPGALCDLYISVPLLEAVGLPPGLQRFGANIWTYAGVGRPGIIRCPLDGNGIKDGAAGLVLFHEFKCRVPASGVVLWRNFRDLAIVPAVKPTGPGDWGFWGYLFDVAIWL